MPVAVVTDSTAYLPPELLEQYDIAVVPLYVVLGAGSGREGESIGPDEVAQVLSTRGGRVTTSRPSPDDFAAAYRRLLDAGAERIVSVHLSAELSGTWDAARLAAAEIGGDVVTVVDTRSAAMGNGFPVLAAARTARAGGDAAAVAAAAEKAAGVTRTFFVVDTLEHLRRGGRIGSAAALLGSALAVKPVLHVVDGRVVVLEKVRTSARAMNRLVQRVVEEVGGGVADLAVHHLAAPEKAEQLAADLRDQVPTVRDLYVSELGAAIGAHVGPGAVGVVVAPEPADRVAHDAEDPAED
ncbi:DegV family protein [Blastococcus sp. CCUG 61487]|uniref:DegV family protein n=1 Tax=Blastococcus sp. CCUG 61487 TaxID=1840703 RepID=UPI0010C00D4C|nr:DegV family protein [Blastococcus sp. CCUG 61487]TKJ31738.1 fatty acid-binding protein DegV [Blastococcus sp. CCUG 61487]